MELAHGRRGTGPPLVLVHGIGMRWQAWAIVVDRLVGERDVIALDLPGFGGSPPDAVEPTVEGLAGAVQGFLAAQGIERPDVAGISLGGGVALELARRGAVRSATALAPVGFWSDRERAYAGRSLALTKAFLRRTGALVPALARTAVGRTMLGGQMFAKPWKVPAAEMVASCDAVLRATRYDETRAALDRHRFAAPEALRGTPVTVAWGDRDRLLLPRQARRAERLLPWARHLTLGGAGHVPFHDDPDAVAAVLLSGSER